MARRPQGRRGLDPQSASGLDPLLQLHSVRSCMRCVPLYVGHARPLRPLDLGQLALCARTDHAHASHARTHHSRHTTAAALVCRQGALRPAPCTLRPASFALHPAPCALRPAPCALHPAPCTLHPAPRQIGITRCQRASPLASSLAAARPAPPPLPLSRPPTSTNTSRQCPLRVFGCPTPSTF